MKFLIFFLLVPHLLYSLSIDTKLFDNEEKENYYKEISNQIEISKTNKPVNILEDEKLYLQRVKSASSQIVQIELYDTKLLSEKPVKIHNYYSALRSSSYISLKKKENQQLLKSINAKLIFLKSSIENITEEDKIKALSYQLQYAYYKL